MKPVNSSEYAKISLRTPEELQDKHRALADLARKAIGSEAWQAVLNKADENNIHDTDTSGNTALHYACEINPKTLVPANLSTTKIPANLLPAAAIPANLLVTSGTSLDLKTIIVELIKKGARLTKRGDGKETPLEILIRKDRLDIIMEVINKYNVDMMDDCGYRAIDYAAKYGNDQIASHLIEKGAKFIKKNGAQLTPLWCMVFNKQFDFIRRVINNNNVNTKDDLNKTLLHYVCELGYLEIFKYLMSLKANPAIKDENGQTPLHLATIHNHKLLVSRLCIQPKVSSTDINNNNSTTIDIKKIADNQGCTAADYAEALQRTEMLKFLRFNTKPMLVKASSEPISSKLISNLKQKPDDSPKDKLLQARSRYPKDSRYPRDRGRSSSFGNDTDAIKAYIQSLNTSNPQLNTKIKQDSSIPSPTQSQAEEESEINPPPNHNPQLQK